MHASPSFGVQIVIEGGKHHLMADQCAVAYRNAALILKTAACVDEYVFSDGDILSAVGIKGREQGKGGVHSLADEL